MMRNLFFVASIFFAGIPSPALAQVKNFAPVTREMLLKPSPDDWIMLSRTYDEQRFSPLRQINRQNVSRLRMAWVRGIAAGTQETIPIVYRGVLYVVTPDATVLALDATNGDLIWEYRRKLPPDLRPQYGETKALAIFENFIFFDSPDGYVVALDARTGALRWEDKVHDNSTGAQHSSAPLVVDGKVISARSCTRTGTRDDCFIVAHDALTGKQLWKFFTTAAPGEPGGDTWGNVPVEKRIASTWGLPGSYDPQRKMIYWGIANPNPYTRMKRHGGNADDIPRSAPSELYSESTVALDPNTGKLAWYFQHVPGDDWDLDQTHERILLRTKLNPDPKAVKWISAKIPRGEERDILVEVAEGGGIWTLDRSTGEFLWATPFPYDTPEFQISRIDLETGKTFLNWDVAFKKDGERHFICFENAKGYFPMAYHPAKNSIYVPYNDTCLDMQANTAASAGFDFRNTVLRPGGDPNALGGLARVNMATGQVEWRYTQRAPTVGAVLATGGDLIFWGDMNRRFRAFDADTGKILWESIVGGIVQNSTITYAVNGMQYIAVMTGDGGAETSTPLALAPEIQPPRRHNSIYVFALP
jgi:alcohol dehydrogenase (cytochrome c)